MHAPFSSGRLSLLLPLAALLLAAPGPVAAPAGLPAGGGDEGVADAAQPAAATVTISFDTRRRVISVDKDRVRAERGRRVEWKMDSDHAWAVIVPSDDRPFGGAVRASGVRGRGAGNARGATIRSDLPRSADDLVYKYFVVVHDEGQLYVLDPEVVVPGG